MRAAVLIVIGASVCLAAGKEELPATVRVSAAGPADGDSAAIALRASGDERDAPRKERARQETVQGRLPRKVGETDVFRDNGPRKPGP
jgi:hypothetical protein